MSKFPELDHLVGNVFIIAFAGKRKSGKSQSTDYVLELNPEFKRMSFAAPLKASFAKHKNIDISWLDHNTYKEEYREELQEYSEPILAQDKYHFTNKLFSKLKPGDKIAIEDLRRLSELEVVCYLKGIPYQVYAEDKERMKRGWVPNKVTDSHWSETELDLEPTVFQDLNGGRIYNNRTKDDLFYQIRGILTKHGQY